MKAVVYNRFGHSEVLEIKEVAKPEPQADEVLIRVMATALNKADLVLMTGSPLLARPMVGSFLKPRENMILGADVSGRIEAVGTSVTGFKVGDDVVGDLSGTGFGGFAEYACAKASLLVKKPETLSYEEAAAIPLAGVTALNAIKALGPLKTGQHIFINGASGGVGNYAIQIAKAMGLIVTAVCSKRHMGMAEALGADHVMASTGEDFTASGNTYDYIHAVNGKVSIFKYKKALKPTGVYVMSGGAMSQMVEAMLLGPMLSKKDGQQFRSVSSKPNQEALQYLMKLAEEGQLKPILDRSYSLENTAEAFKYFESGQAKGKLVILGTH